jgi:copper homeostasis protein (lipoprotein)
MNSARNTALAASWLPLIGLLLASGCATPETDTVRPPQAAQAGHSDAEPAADLPYNPDPAHYARNSLDWAGIYHGVLPCADCPGIDTVVTLTMDGTYRLQTRYIDRDEQVFEQRGEFEWNDAGNTVTLLGSEQGPLFVGENHLVQLAQDGSRVTGDLADHHVLTQRMATMTGTQWRLVELNGRVVPALDRAPYMILSADGTTVQGLGGCNGFSGDVELDEGNWRMSFGDIAATMMLCDRGSDVEREFFEVLDRADNYSLSGALLTLNRARMAPLARFEAVIEN